VSASANPGSSSRAAGTAALTAALMIAQQVGAKAARDALFLSHFAPSALPAVMGAAAVLGIGTALVSGRWLARVGPSRCVPWLFGLNAATFAGEYLFALPAPAQVAVVLYLHVASIGAVAASGFWSAINERFDPYKAKRVIGRIGAGATLGGVLGGLATERLGRMLPIGEMLLGFALLNALTAAGAWLLRDSAEARTGRAPEPGEPGVRVLGRTPYLRDLALLVGLLAVADTLVDYVFKAEAGRALGQGEGLLAFFALFYTLSSLLTFALQWVASRKALERLGLGGSVALLPGSILLTSAIGIAAPGLVAVGALRGLSAVLESSLYRSGYELLFTPLAPAAKRATKALLDVAISRAGTIAGSGVAVATLALWPAVAHPLLLATCAVLSAGALMLSLRLHAGYVAQLAHSLRAGVVQLDEREVVDPATRRTLAESVATLDRAELLRKLEELKRTSLIPAAPIASASAGAGAGEAAGAGEPVAPAWIARATALASGERARVGAALREPLEPELIAPALALLADDALAPEVSNALRAVAPRCSGQLLDALLDRERPLALRRRLPKILEAASGERVQRGLLAALGDDAFAVRARAAQALAAVVEHGGGSALSEAEIWHAVRRELERSEAGESVVPAASDPPPSEIATPSSAPHAPHLIELLFALFGVCLEREAVALSLQAILGDDSRLRGTALEYLDNVLPPDVRERVWPFLRAARSERPKRATQAIVQELLTSSAHVRVRR
jgi:ATP:ADP antiporter, AAA family